MSDSDTGTQAVKDDSLFQGFMADGGVNLSLLRTPRPWSNMLFNGSHFSSVTQLAEGRSYSQDAMGRSLELSKGRMFFLRDSLTGQTVSLNGVDLPGGVLTTKCVHHLGYSEWLTSWNGIDIRLRVFVPREGLGEVWQIHFSNNTVTDRSLDLFSSSTIDFDRPVNRKTRFTTSGSWHAEIQAAILSRRFIFKGTVRNVFAFMSSDQPVSGYDTSFRAWCGQGTHQRPDTVFRCGTCAGSNCEAEKSTLALQLPAKLAANSTWSTQILLGSAASEAEMISFRQRLLSQRGAAGAEWLAVRELAKHENGQNAIECAQHPWLAGLFNHWLPRQINLGSRWVQGRNNGMRELLQDNIAYAIVQPTFARRRLHKILDKQHANGLCPRAWDNGAIEDCNVTDGGLWIPLAVYQIFLETGDTTILEDIIPFNDGTHASMYEHAKRALDYLREDRGLFGLCRIHSGDWNESLDTIGAEGRGVSIWMSQAFVLAANGLAQMAEALGYNFDANEARSWAREMKDAVNQHGWEGEYYMRAFKDDNEPLGVAANPQGSIFLDCQVWAVIAGVADTDRGNQILDRAEDRLRMQLGIRDLDIPFSDIDVSVGSISASPVGYPENGGVTMRSVACKMIADCILKRGSSVENGWRDILPLDNHGRPKRDGEPYVINRGIFNQVGSYRHNMDAESWEGLGAAWPYTAFFAYMLGLRPGMHGLTVDPCLPESFPEMKVTRFFRDTEYKLHYLPGIGTGPVEVTVEGKALGENPLPIFPGKVLNVVVRPAGASA